MKTKRGKAMNANIEKQLQRLKGLLNPERTRIELKPAELEIPPEELGALAGVGYTTPNMDAFINVYIFEDWSKHKDVSKRLKSDYADDDAMYVRTITNGPMLMFARTSIGKNEEEIDAQLRIGNIISAFAGDE